MLMRTELGDQIQGIDYLFNGQGWVMGVNSGDLSSRNDLGEDGKVTPLNPSEDQGNGNSNFAKDAFGYALGYFKGAYQSINPTSKTKIRYNYYFRNYFHLLLCLVKKRSQG